MDAARSSARPDLELIAPFIMGIIETFRVQYQLEVKHREPFTKGSQPQVEKDLLAFFTVFSAQTSISVAFCFPKTTYETLFKIQTASESERGATIEDSIRELVNIVFNKVKKFMNTDGRVIQRGIPAIVFGSGLKLWYLTVGNSVVITFEVGTELFEIEINMER
jgi:CheY-specific phosphatase CheX